MFDDHIINGGRKVSRKPSLSIYDNRKPPTAGADPAYDAVYAGRFDSDAPRTWAQDRALLVSLGVNGEVPFFEAAVNAGLPIVGQQRGVRFAGNDLWHIPANDNTRSAAIAA